MTNFVSATTARAAAKFDVIVYDEISTIERAILVAADATFLEVTVDDDTVMTNSTPADVTSQSYFDVWQKNVIDRTKLAQMMTIINYFEGLGYSIVRETNGNDATVLQWTVSW